MDEVAKLYDYIYVDIDKVVSLYSQLTGGVVEYRELSSSSSQSSDNKRHYDFKVFKHDAGGSSLDGSSSKASIKPHHSLLQELEFHLEETGHLLELGSLDGEATLKTPETRDLLKNTLCVKCSGRIVLECYERLKKISEAFPELVRIINRSQSETLKTTPEYKEIEAKISALEHSSDDRNQKAKNKQKAKNLKKQLDQFLESSIEIESTPEWILSALNTWIDTFLPSITNIRLYPFSDESDEHVFGHLDSDYFTASNLDSLHYTYGAFPTENFTMVGIVTSVPEEGSDSFNPAAEFDKGDLGKGEGFEKALRGVFKGFDGMEAFIRTCRYPRLLVLPILVYRESAARK